MGFFSKIKDGLKKTKDSWGKKIFEVFKARELDDDFYDELEFAMVSADMGVTATDAILNELKDVIFEKKITSPDLARKELKRLMLESIDYEIPEYEYPLVILVAGVNGVGKTTAIGKLAKLFTSSGKSVIVAAADTFRAAAGEQLSVWAQRANVKIVSHGEGSDPSAVVFDAVSSMKAKKTDVLIVDTAGRLHVKANLMEELKKIDRVGKREYPEANFYKFIVLDATTGQNALSQVAAFDDAVGIDGIVLTKLDGTAKGGFVISLCDENEIPVVFVGTGEGMGDIEKFDSQSFIDGLL